MNNGLEHLPETKQDELKLLAELFASSDKVKMVILFGSYARGSWVKDSYLEKGVMFEYESDYDLLILMDNEDMSLNHHFDNRIKKELLFTRKLKTPVSCIFHGIDRVNEALSEGHYFFTDIKKEGIILVDKGEIELVEPRILSPGELQQISRDHFNQWYGSALEFLDTSRDDINKKRLPKAAFELHQATERFYVTILLVFTGYRPKTHSLDALSFRAMLLDERFREVFSRVSKPEKDRFNLLHRAYIDARYKMDEYQITEADLIYLEERVNLLQKLTKDICLEKIEEFGR